MEWYGELNTPFGKFRIGDKVKLGWVICYGDEIDDENIYTGIISLIGEDYLQLDNNVSIRSIEFDNIGIIEKID